MYMEEFILHKSPARNVSRFTELSPLVVNTSAVVANLGLMEKAENKNVEQEYVEDENIEKKNVEREKQMKA